MLTIHATGDWRDGAVRVERARSSRAVIPDVEASIERAWASASTRPGVHLFDGAMCRLESWTAAPALLSLSVSPTTYKTFVGTNMGDPARLPPAEPAASANPVGMSVVLSSADGFLVFGRRNARVAYYPDRVHPIAGSLEPADADDVFRGVRRELDEELGLTAAELADLACVGLVEDRRLRQPELVFRASGSRTLSQIRATLDATEHRATYEVPADRAAAERALADPALTPVAVGSLLLWGRGSFGEAWFESARAATAGCACPVSLSPRAGSPTVWAL